MPTTCIIINLNALIDKWTIKDKEIEETDRGWESGALEVLYAPLESQIAAVRQGLFEITYTEIIQMFWFMVNNIGFRKTNRNMVVGQYRADKILQRDAGYSADKTIVWTTYSRRQFRTKKN